MELKDKIFIFFASLVSAILFAGIGLFMSTSFLCTHVITCNLTPTHEIILSAVFAAFGFGLGGFITYKLKYKRPL